MLADNVIYGKELMQLINVQRCFSQPQSCEYRATHWSVSSAATLLPITHEMINPELRYLSQKITTYGAIKIWILFCGRPGWQAAFRVLPVRPSVRPSVCLARAT